MYKYLSRHYFLNTVSILYLYWIRYYKKNSLIVTVIRQNSSVVNMDFHKG